MNYVIWLLFWISIFGVRLGDTTTLPDGIEDIKSYDNYACYGCNGIWQPTCEHKPSTVMAVQAIKLGTKQRDLNCPGVITANHSVECKHPRCCQPNVTEDCIQDYDYKMSGIDYRYHRNCSGRASCSDPIEIVFDLTCPSCNLSIYMDNTNYLYIEYGCIKESHMTDMCKNGTHRSDGTTLYLHTPQYPDHFDLQMTSDCTCSMASYNDTKLYAYLIDVQLVEQTLTIERLENNSFSYDNSSATLFNVTELDIGHGANITLENLSETNAGTKVWIGIKAKTGAPFEVTCWGPSTEKVNNTSTDSPPSNLFLIIGIAVGVLLLLVVITCCCLYRCFKKPKQRQERDEKDAEANRKLADGDQPRNSTFDTHRIPKNSVAPTPFIEEHGGASRLPPIVNTAHAIPALSNGGPAPLKLFEASHQVEIEDRKEKKHRKKIKKRRKHKKHKRQHENEAMEVDTAKDTDKVDANKDMDNVDANKGIDNVDANKDMDNVDANKDMDNVDAYKGIDNVDANKDMDNADVNKDMDNADVNKDMDNADVNKDMDKVGVNKDTDNDANKDIGKVECNKNTDSPGLNINKDNVDAKEIIHIVEVDEYMNNADVNHGETEA